MPTPLPTTHRGESALPPEAATHALPHERLLDMSSDAVLIRDAADRIIFWNRTAEIVYGFARPQALGRLYADLLRPEYATLAPHPKTVLAETGHWRGEVTHVTKDGRVITVASSWIADRGPSGEVRVILETNTDLTAQKRAAEAQRNNESWVRHAVEAAGVVLFDMDLTTGYVRCSENARGIWGISEGTAETFFSMVHPDDRAELQRKATAAAGGARGYLLEYRVISPTGKVHWLSSRGDTVADASGRAIRLTGVSVDVTARRQAEEYSKRLGSIVEATSHYVAIARMDGTVDYMNQAWRRLRSLDRDVGPARLTFKDLCPPKVAAKARRTWLPQAMLHGSAAGEASLSDAAGREVPVSFVLLVHRDPRATAEFISIIAQDISAIRGAEQQIRHSEATLRSFCDSSPLLMGLVELTDDETDLLHVYGNPASEQFFGVAPGGSAGRLASELGAPPAHIRMWIERYREASQLGEPVRFDYAHTLPSGATAWLSCVVAQVRAPSTPRPRFSFVVADVTENKETQLALQRAQAQLQQHAGDLERMVQVRTAQLREANEQLEVVLYSVAHDLRAPLRALTGYAGLLQGELATGLSPDASRMIGRIGASANFMDRMLRDLLDFGRTARSEIELRPTKVEAAWRNARFQCSAQIEAVGASVITADPMPVVLAHGPTLAQVLANLLSNAIKFAKPGTRPEVRFTAEELGSHVRLCVEDNGLGIAPEHHTRIFGLFERLSSGSEGTGVGLAVVAKGAERMKGRCGVDSEPGRGSRFWIELPKAEVDDETRATNDR